MTRLWTAGFGSLLTLVGLGALGWVASERALRPGQRIEEYAPEDLGLPVEHVRFPSADGTPLAGWFAAGGPKAIILLHGYARSKAELLPHAAFLYRAGYSVLLLDFRGRGESDGRLVTLGLREPLDVLGAVEFLEDQKGIKDIALLGVSLGAAVGIMAAIHREAIAAVVAEAPFAGLLEVARRHFHRYVGLPAFPFAPITAHIVRWRLGTRAQDIAPLEAIERLSPRPVLLIHGLADTEIDPAASRSLFALAGEPKELWLVPGAPHARVYQWIPQEYEERVLAFLGRYLPP
ncbi:MAG TPA: alpha/beta fold hydrolase [Dehalococcoidia bacterium]|nr:alpha/beta fold hydrolase [Dehalococcoidia bacterium]